MAKENFVSLCGKDPPLAQEDLRLCIIELQKIIDSSSLSSQDKTLWREKIDEAEPEIIKALLFKISNELKISEPNVSDVNAEDIISAWNSIF